TQAEKSRANNSIIFPGFIQDNELQNLYQSALAYIFPSLYEGFGLPPLEAMSQGCPVISSNQASLPEILKEGAIYFSPIDLWDFTNQVEKIINNKEIRNFLIIKGREVVNNYSWQKCAEETLKIYRKSL
ncbi:MAG: glycosyltransferase, partial [Candidatus Falkowbacteria bacterium]|nr:glycosyltransferase [Candidatus Falkowbacteria bacterium]